MPGRDHFRASEDQVTRENVMECVDGRVVHRANLS